MKDKLSLPRSVRTSNTKEKIYEAAEEILKKKGYEYLSVKNICQVAGISNGTFYYHYKSKEQLLSYYLNEGFAKFRSDRNFNVDDLEFKEKILEYYVCYAAYVEETGLEFISNYYMPKNKALNTRGHRALSNLGNPIAEHTWVINLTYKSLEEAEKNSLLNPKFPAIHYANNCCTLLKGIIFDWALTNGNIDMEDLIRELIGTYLDSISE